MKKWKLMTLTTLAGLTLAACGTGGTPADDPAPTDPGTDTSTDVTPHTGSETGISSDQASTSTPASDSQNDSLADVITMAEALDVYWADYPDAQIEEVDFDDDRTHEWTYEITGVYENREYEVEINALTGEIIKVDEDDADTDEEYLDFDTIIDPQEAIDIATAELSADAIFDGWHLDMDDNRPEYEVDFEGADHRDVKINAETGDVIEIDD